MQGKNFLVGEREIFYLVSNERSQTSNILSFFLTSHRGKTRKCKRTHFSKSFDRTLSTFFLFTKLHFKMFPFKFLFKIFQSSGLQTSRVEYRSNLILWKNCDERTDNIYDSDERSTELYFNRFSGIANRTDILQTKPFLKHHFKVNIWLVLWTDDFSRYESSIQR